MRNWVGYGSDTGLRWCFAIWKGVAAKKWRISLGGRLGR